MFINFINLTFDQFNASILNSNKKFTDPKLLKGSIYIYTHVYSL